MTTPQPYIVQPDGWHVKKKNPFDDIKCHPCNDNSDSAKPCTCTKYEQFEANNPTLPLTAWHQPGSEVIGVPVTLEKKPNDTKWYPCRLKDGKPIYKKGWVQKQFFEVISKEKPAVDEAKPDLSVEADIHVLEYQTVIQRFSELMLNEMIANHDKGGRVGENGYMTCDARYMLQELYYHVGKLQQAIAEGNQNLIKEYCADIGNLAMMTCDIKFVLASIPFKPEITNHAIQSKELVKLSDIRAIFQNEINTVGNDIVCVSMIDVLSQIEDIKNSKP